MNDAASNEYDDSAEGAGAENAGAAGNTDASGLIGRESSVIPGRFGDPMTVTHAEWSQDHGRRNPGRPLFLLIHGWGSTAADMMEFFSAYVSPFSDYVALQSPLTMPDYPAAATWFHDCVPTGEDLDRDAFAAATGIDAWVHEHVPDDRAVIPLGFSQGGLLAVHLLRVDPKRYAAAVTLSGFLAPGIVPGTAPHDDELAELDTSVFYGVGGRDTCIPRYEAKAFEAWLEEHTYLKLCEYPNMDHSICLDEVDDLRTWLVSIGASSGLM
ncbi:alpha/beta hydrolase [Pseudoscardovia radai]|uniref:alpha/beta hydrolase n=1 Tax=Pseudoscardovia radai TaxID=987066 RepID=UPI003991633C